MVHSPPDSADSTPLLQPDVGAMLQRERRRKWMRRLVWALLLPVIVAGGWFAYARLSPPPAPVQYRTEAATRGTLEITVTATGTLEPVRTVDVGPEISGRVVTVLAEVNELVRAGQELVRLDDEPLLAKKEQALAQLESAEASVRQASTTLEETRLAEKRVKVLRSKGIQAEADLEVATAARARASAALAAAKAQRRLAQAQLQSVETDLAKAVIRAPVDGVVLTRTVEPGMAVVASLQAPVLFTIAQGLENMRLNLAVDEADVGKVKEGMRATFTVDAFPERRFEARVVRVHLAPIADETVVTYETELDVDNSEALIRPGMTATASIVSDTVDGVLLVPNAALRFTPPATEDSAASGPGNPFMPMRPRSTPRPTNGSPGSANGPGGTAGPRDRVWVLEGDAPKEVRVRAVATDGRRTAIEGEGIAEGTEVVVGIAQAKRTP